MIRNDPEGMVSPHNALTEVELQILGILWGHGPSPVRVIHERLEAMRGTNYSTTVKMLSVMLQKSLVTRNEDERPHIYRPALTRKAAGRRMMRNLVDRIYEGSTMSLVMQALTTSKPSTDEIAEVRRLLDRMEDQP